MKLEHDDQFPDGFFRYHATLKQLERQLFAHIRELGNLRTLYGLEEMVYCLISDELDNDLALDLSRIIVKRTVERVIHDTGFEITTVPHGISRAERFAAFFEPGCPFCEAKFDLQPATAAPPDDDCPCCDRMVKEWRAKHADALRKFKLRAA